MKIFFIGGRDIFSVGGIENWMLHLSTALAARGHDVTVCCESDRDGVRFEQDVRVLYFKAPRNRYFCKILVSRRATRRAIEEGCDLIHYNVWPSAVWSFKAERKGIKTILMGHGFEWKRSKYSAFQRFVLRWCEACAARRHRHIVLCSQEQTDWYVKHYGCEGKAVTIPSAVDLPPAGEDGKMSAAVHDPVMQTILYMGRISSEKNVDKLLYAFSRIQAERRRNVRLLIAGPMDESAAYGQEIRRQISSTPSVAYIGEVFGQEKEDLLRHTDLFCLPSSVEGLSIALLEAAAHRIPIIASDIPSNREALGDAALWCNPEDAFSLEAALRQALDILAAVPAGSVPAGSVPAAPVPAGSVPAVASAILPMGSAILPMGSAVPLQAPTLLQRNAQTAYERVAAHFTWDRTVALYEEYIRSVTDSK